MPIFCKTNCVSPKNKTKWDSLLVYSDDDVKIWNPRTYEQSTLIGLPIWCICFNEGYWNEHVNIHHETVYMVYNVLEDSIHQYTCCLVSPNGNITIYDSEHNRLDGMQVSQYLNTLGCGKQYLKSLQLQENKQYRNTTMKQKQTLKLTESQLRNMIKEKIKNVLGESYGTMSTQDSADIAYQEWKKENQQYLETFIKEYLIEHLTTTIYWDKDRLLIVLDIDGNGFGGSGDNYYGMKN